MLFAIQFAAVFSLMQEVYKLFLSIKWFDPTCRHVCCYMSLYSNVVIYIYIVSTTHVNIKMLLLSALCSE